MRCLKSICLPVTLLMWMTGFAGAQQMSSNSSLMAPTETSGMVGITTGQTARLNALNPGVPAPLATGARCSVQVSFVDDQGNVLKNDQITVNPGKSTPFEFVMSSAGRLEIRAVITFSQPTPVANPSTGTAIAFPLAVLCPLIPSLEIVDPDNKTQVVLTDFHFLSYGFMTSMMGASIPPR